MPGTVLEPIFLSHVHAQMQIVCWLLPISSVFQSCDVVFELFVSKYLSGLPINQLDKLSALSTISKPFKPGGGTPRRAFSRVSYRGYPSMGQYATQEGVTKLPRASYFQNMDTCLLFAPSLLQMQQSSLMRERNERKERGRPLMLCLMQLLTRFVVETVCFTKPNSFNVECACPVETVRLKFLSPQLLSHKPYL